jgi:hypothetical protein
MACRNPVGIRLITRRGNDWSERFPLVIEAVKHLQVRSCLIDGEVVCCDEKGLNSFQLLRYRRNETQAFLYAFDQLELHGQDLGDAPGMPSPCARPASCRNRQGKTGLRRHSGGGAVGRIYDDHLRWFWSFTVTGQLSRSGKVATLEEAKAQFRKSWDAGRRGLND